MQPILFPLVRRQTIRSARQLGNPRLLRGGIPAGSPAIVTGSATLTAVAALVASALLIIPATATVSAADSLTGAGIVEVRAGATLTAASSLAGSAQVDVHAAAALEAAAVLAAAGETISSEPDRLTSGWAWAIPDPPKPLLVVDGRATLTAGSRLTAAGQVISVPAVRSGSAALRARGTLAGAGLTIVHGGASFAARGGLKAASMVIVCGAATLDGGAAGFALRRPAVDDDDDAEDELLIALGIL